jgi:hypothetical protein
MQYNLMEAIKLENKCNLSNNVTAPSVWPIPSHPHRSTQIYLEYIRSFRAVVPSQFLANNWIHPPYASPANHVRVQSAHTFKCFREASCFTHNFKGRVGSERPRDCGTHLRRYHLRLRLGLAFWLSAVWGTGMLIPYAYLCATII